MALLLACALTAQAAGVGLLAFFRWGGPGGNTRQRSGKIHTTAIIIFCFGCAAALFFAVAERHFLLALGEAVAAALFGVDAMLCRAKRRRAA